MNLFDSDVLDQYYSKIPELEAKKWLSGPLPRDRHNWQGLSKEYVMNPATGRFAGEVCLADDAAVESAIVSAGEACHASLVTQHYQTLSNTDLYNEYGPTEATVSPAPLRSHQDQASYRARTTGPRVCR